MAPRTTPPFRADHVGSLLRTAPLKEARAKHAAKQIEKTLRSAVANAEHASRENNTDLDVDSLDLAELSQIIEDEFGVQLKGDDVGKIKTVGDAVELVVSRAG